MVWVCYQNEILLVNVDASASDLDTLIMAYPSAIYFYAKFELLPEDD